MPIFWACFLFGTGMLTGAILLLIYAALAMPRWD